MKKTFKIIIVTLIALTMAATGFAAQTFSDVPRGHWAYDAVSKLAKANLIEGYDDGTFRGDKSMNRYEFAILTVKAIDRFDRADEMQKRTIDQLSAEFAAELNRMGTRIAKVEAKTNTWFAGGDVRFRYLGNSPNSSLGLRELRGSEQTDYRFRFKIAGNINDNTAVEARFSNNWGNKFGNSESVIGSTAYFDIINVTTKNALGFDSIRVGRSALDTIGNGLIIMDPFVKTPFFDLLVEVPQSFS